MQNGFGTVKDPGGKLVKVKLSYTGVIEAIEITGDFFLYPEEKLLIIEKSLKGIPLKKEQITNHLYEIIRQEKIQLIGMTVESITQAILEAGSCTGDLSP